MRCWLHTVGSQRERRRQGQAAKARISKVGLPVKLDPQQHMSACRDHLIRHIPAHPGCEPTHLKAQGTQDGVQEQILLEAIATPLALDELMLERGKIETHRLTQEGREVLEWKRVGRRRWMARKVAK